MAAYRATHVAEGWGWRRRGPDQGRRVRLLGVRVLRALGLSGPLDRRLLRVLRFGLGGRRFLALGFGWHLLLNRLCHGANLVVDPPLEGVEGRWRDVEHLDIAWELDAVVLSDKERSGLALV